VTHTAFDIFLYGAFLERVYYTAGHSADEVRLLLLADNYPTQITVHLAAKRTG
jgi:hypothetical protein